MVKNLLCFFGFHKWSKTKSHNVWSSNIIDYQKYCLKCHNVKKWNKIKTYDLD